jgi:hypothetical protein
VHSQTRTPQIGPSAVISPTDNLSEFGLFEKPNLILNGKTTKDTMSMTITASLPNTTKINLSVSPSQYQKAEDSIFDMPDEEEYDFEDDIDECPQITEPRTLELMTPRIRELNCSKRTFTTNQTSKPQFMAPHPNLPFSLTQTDYLAENEPVISKNLELRQKRVIINPQLFKLMKN